jgi:hypothetical protein
LKRCTKPQANRQWSIVQIAELYDQAEIDHE